MQTDDNTPGEDAQEDADAEEAPEHNAELVDPEENPEDDGAVEAGAIFIGEPFAMAGLDGENGNVQFLDANPASKVPGCFASVLCSCGQPFKLNLLPADGVSEFCPGCDTEYTSALVVGAVDDPHIWNATMMHVFQVNGMAPEPSPEDEDEDEDEDDTNGAGIPDATTK